MGPDEATIMLKALIRQVFDLSYYGKISAEYVATLPTDERLYLLELLLETKEQEAKEYERSIKTNNTSPPLHPRIKV